MARPRRKTRGRKAKGAAERSSGGAPLLNKKKNSKRPMEDQDLQRGESCLLRCHFHLLFWEGGPDPSIHN